VPSRLTTQAGAPCYHAASSARKSSERSVLSPPGERQEGFAAEVGAEAVARDLEVVDVE
jgi:hypothetical protein